jgi:hypothetical protein
MSALWAMVGCAVSPPLLLEAIRGWFGVSRGASAVQQQRALEQSQRATLLASAIGLPLAAVVGALTAPEVLSTRWPAAGAWFFAGICATLAWSSLSLSHRTQEEAEAMKPLEAIGRVVQMVTVPSTAVAFSLLATAGIEATLPLADPARAAVAGCSSVLGLLVVAPWLAMQLGLWRLLPGRIQTRDRAWRVAHLPVPNPFVAHAAALPWLRTVAVTDGLFTRVPDSHWRSLVYFEIGGARPRSGERAARWAVALTLSVTLFMFANHLGAEDPRKLVAGTIFAVMFTGAASWFANREDPKSIVFDPDGPSMQELAHTLRNLPPAHGQALPTTSHRPVGVLLYDRLFALGHDPGRRRGA